MEKKLTFSQLLLKALIQFKMSLAILSSPFPFELSDCRFQAREVRSSIMTTALVSEFLEVPSLVREDKVFEIIDFNSRRQSGGFEDCEVEGS